MELSSQSLRTEDSNDIEIQKTSRDSTSDLFPYAHDDAFKTPSSYMQVVGMIKNGCTFPIEDYENDMEESEYILEDMFMTFNQTDLIKRRQQDLVYEDNFNQSVMNIVGRSKFSYDKLVEVCSKYESEDKLDEHSRSSDEHWKYFEKRMDEYSGRAVAFAIAFYTGSQSSGINRSASVIARTSNGEVFEAIRKGDLEDASIILYYLVRGLAHIPYYWGTATRAMQLTDKELDSYKPGTLITWLQFSSSIKGCKPPRYFAERNTRCIIYSLTGRSIQNFSIFPEEDEVLFLPHSTFLVLQHLQDKDTHFIHMRQIELGFCRLTVLWVDDRIFDKKWENKEHMQLASARSLDDNVHFIPKSTTNQALSFLRSAFGQRLKNCETFRIVTDMIRLNEEEPQYAGVRFINGLRQLGFQNQCLIFTSDEQTATEKTEERLSEDERKDLSITVDSQVLQQFVSFEV